MKSLNIGKILTLGIMLSINAICLAQNSTYFPLEKTFEPYTYNVSLNSIKGSKNEKITINVENIPIQDKIEKIKLEIDNVYVVNLLAKSEVEIKKILKEKPIDISIDQIQKIVAIFSTIENMEVEVNKVSAMQEMEKILNKVSIIVASALIDKSSVEIGKVLQKMVVEKSKVQVKILLEAIAISKTEIQLEEILKATDIEVSKLSVYDCFSEGILYWISKEIKIQESQGNTEEAEKMKKIFIEKLIEWLWEEDDVIDPPVDEAL